MSDTARKRFAAMSAKLKSSGLKMTPQRLAVLKLLAESEGHPSADDIRARLQKKFPGISQATVYRTIQLAKSLGEAYEIAFAGSGSRYDGRKPHSHPHLVCLDCGRIVDPELLGLGEMTREAAAASGFAITTFRLDFFGLCPACRKKKNRSGKIQ